MHSVSKHLGNTKKIAKTLADELSCDCVELSKVEPEELMHYDLICLGSGIYAWDFDRSVHKLISKIPCGVGKKVLLFSTSADPNGLKYHRRLRKLLKEKNFELVGELNCTGEFRFRFFKNFVINKGRPNASDLDNVRESVRRLLRTLEGGSYEGEKKENLTLERLFRILSN